jgi:succinate dehydrogenase / fumarate reductase membrane anchor subunit
VKLRLSGPSAWWAQRLSAVLMLLFATFVATSLVAHPVAGYGQWRDWVAAPGVSLAFVVFFGALLVHMWVGLRDVVLDYAKPSLRLALLGVVALGLLGLGAWLLVILLRLRA